MNESYTNSYWQRILAENYLEFGIDNQKNKNLQD